SNDGIHSLARFLYLSETSSTDPLWILVAIKSKTHTVVGAVVTENFTTASTMVSTSHTLELGIAVFAVVAILVLYPLRSSLTLALRPIVNLICGIAPEIDHT